MAVQECVVRILNKFGELDDTKLKLWGNDGHPKVSSETFPEEELPEVYVHNPPAGGLLESKATNRKQKPV